MNGQKGTINPFTVIAIVGCGIIIGYALRQSEENEEKDKLKDRILGRAEG